MVKKNRLGCMFALLLMLPLPIQAAQAVFAGGSFWVMEALFAQHLGVTEVTSGWMQTSEHALRRQAVLLEYDSQIISYGQLLNLYWATIDPFDAKGQYCDRGREYSPALYVKTRLQLRLAQQSRATIALEQAKPVATRILSAGIFTPAAERHQQYYRQHPILYAGYWRMCGYPKIPSYTNLDK